MWGNPPEYHMYRGFPLLGNVAKGNIFSFVVSPDDFNSNLN